MVIVIRFSKPLSLHDLQNCLFYSPFLSHKHSGLSPVTKVISILNSYIVQFFYMRSITWVVNDIEQIVFMTSSRNMSKFFVLPKDPNTTCLTVILTKQTFLLEGLYYVPRRFDRPNKDVPWQTTYRFKGINLHPIDKQVVYIESCCKSKNTLS